MPCFRVRSSSRARLMRSSMAPGATPTCGAAASTETIGGCGAFDDLFAVCEQLITEDVTSPDRLAFQGSSHGGIVAGAAASQRPDLFRAVVAQVPLLNPLRADRFALVMEFGDGSRPPICRTVRFCCASGRTRGMQEEATGRPRSTNRQTGSPSSCRSWA
ncbi:MAG: hypothetical protein DMF90_02080 [Acidobacteria bacterium]|nr:MAG: hypothetical protein DMF90_02080 [Acidobacteriota bacterium]